MRIVWIMIGGLCVTLGAIGIFVPLMPSVVFLLMAAYAFAQSSDRLHDWLMNHQTFGPPINGWIESGAISRKAKILATGSVAVSFLVAWLSGAPVFALVITIVVLICVLIFIWSRPEI